MALEFDGSSQHIRVTQNSGLPIYNDTSYSVCGWVKASAQDDKRIFAEGSSASNNPLLTIGSGHASQSKLGMLVRNDAGTTLLGEGALKESTGDVFDSTWHHFCWVDNNGDADLYIDGTLDATNFNYTRSGTFTFNRTGIAAIIRAEVAYWLNGELFDIRCYNRCLTANEIAEIYHHRGADKVWQGLVGRWRLDELPSGTPAPLLLDAMDATTGWGASPGDSISLNTTTYQEGSGAINFIKGTIARIYSWMYKTITSVNVTGQTIKLWIYIKDQTTLNKISFVNVRLYSTYDTAAKWGSILNADLAVGWNLFSKHINDFNDIGIPDITAITTLRVQVYTNNASDTISEGNLIYDFYRAGDYSPSSIIDLSGNGNHGTPYYYPVFQASPHRLRRGVLVS